MTDVSLAVSLVLREESPTDSGDRILGVVCRSGCPMIECYGRSRLALLAAAGASLEQQNALAFP